MDMSKVIEAAIKAGALEQVSQMTGISQKDAGNVVNVVLPLLLKGMQSQAKSKDTQEGFFQALSVLASHEDSVICFHTRLSHQNEYQKNSKYYNCDQQKDDQDSRVKFQLCKYSTFHDYSTLPSIVLQDQV